MDKESTWTRTLWSEPDSLTLTTKKNGRFDIASAPLFFFRRCVPNGSCMQESSRPKYSRFLPPQNSRNQAACMMHRSACTKRRSVSLHAYQNSDIHFSFVFSESRHLQLRHRDENLYLPSFSSRERERERERGFSIWYRLVSNCDDVLRSMWCKKLPCPMGNGHGRTGTVDHILHTVH